MKKSVVLVTSVFAIFLLLSACSKTGNQSVAVKIVPKAVVSTAVPKELSIDIKDLNFVPGTATMKAGGKVTWTNSDVVQHQLVSGKLFDSGTLDKGATYSHIFDTPGTYDYNCSIHPTMLGKIVVVE